MTLEEFKNEACLSTLNNSPRKPEFIDYNEAYYRVNTIYDPSVIGGAHQFPLDKIKEFIKQIDCYNKKLEEGDPKTIKSIRAWKAVSKYNDEFNCVSDLLLVPVREDGDDAHAHSESSPKYCVQNNPEDSECDECNEDEKRMLMLGSFRPCPNLCGTSSVKYFHTSDSAGDGFPDPTKNPYKACNFSSLKAKRNDIEIGPNDFIE